MQIHHLSLFPTFRLITEYLTNCMRNTEMKIRVEDNSPAFCHFLSSSVKTARGWSRVPAAGPRSGKLGRRRGKCQQPRTRWESKESERWSKVEPDWKRPEAWTVLSQFTCYTPAQAELLTVSHLQEAESSVPPGWMNILYFNYWLFSKSVSILTTAKRGHIQILQESACKHFHFLL